MVHQAYWTQDADAADVQDAQVVVSSLRGFRQDVAQSFGVDAVIGGLGNAGATKLAGRVNDPIGIAK
jgi:hypothetical protein